MAIQNSSEVGTAMRTVFSNPCLSPNQVGIFICIPLNKTPAPNIKRAFNEKNTIALLSNAKNKCISIRPSYRILAWKLDMK